MRTYIIGEQREGKSRFMLNKIVEKIKEKQQKVLRNGKTKRKTR